MLDTSIFSFSHNVLLPSKKEFLFLSYIYFVIFNLAKSKILLCGKELKQPFTLSHNNPDLKENLGKQRKLELSKNMT